MSLYNHVPNKAALLDGMAEVAIEEMLASVEEADDWVEALRVGARAYYQLAYRHPNIYPLVTIRPLNTPDAWRLVERGVALARRAGFSAETALYALRTCACYASGYALNQIARDVTYTADQPADSRLDITKLPPDAFPHLAAVAPYYDPTYRDREFEYGLDAILTGLQTKLLAERAH
jgi:AcrR family transcriptional regulator